MALMLNVKITVISSVQSCNIAFKADAQLELVIAHSHLPNKQHWIGTVLTQSKATDFYNAPDGDIRRGGRHEAPSKVRGDTEEEGPQMDAKSNPVLSDSAGQSLVKDLTHNGIHRHSPAGAQDGLMAKKILHDSVGATAGLATRHIEAQTPGGVYGDPPATCRLGDRLRELQHDTEAEDEASKTLLIAESRKRVCQGADNVRLGAGFSSEIDDVGSRLRESSSDWPLMDMTQTRAHPDAHQAGNEVEVTVDTANGEEGICCASSNISRLGQGGGAPVAWESSLSQLFLSSVTDCLPDHMTLT